MPKPTKGKRLGGSSSHEDQIIANLIKSVLEHEKIETTITKAKIAAIKRSKPLAASNLKNHLKDEVI